MTESGYIQMFASGMKEATSKEVILDHPIESFEIIIDWAYCQPIEITDENVRELYHLADYFNIPDLALECLMILLDCFSDQPMLEIDYWRTQVGVIDIGKIIDRYICLNFRKIISTSKFLTYDVDTVDYIVSCNKLDIDKEIEVFDAIMMWIYGNIEKNLVHLPRLLTKLHWYSITHTEFIDKIASNSCIKGNKDCHAIIMSAFGLIHLGSSDSAISQNLKLEPRDFHGSPTRLFFLTDVSESKKKVEWLDDFGGVQEICILDYDPTLVARRLQHAHISEHCFSDYIVQIDWKRRRWNHFKNDELIITKLFEHVITFEKIPEGKVCLKKGPRTIELAPVALIEHIDHDGLEIRSVTQYKSWFYTIAKSFWSKHKIVVEEFHPMENIWKLVSNDISAEYQHYEEHGRNKNKHLAFGDYLILFLDDSCSIYDINSKEWSHQQNPIRGSTSNTVFCVHQSKLLAYDFCQHILREFTIASGELVSLSERKIKDGPKSSEIFSASREFLKYSHET
ncbi:uncharacterized protein LOC107367795 isoform X2 [Tetranychus urticae]|uniref:uncharacterized protein LOC107367795 isoform X2 n=1 Tax=Tetranychus urticae TaxID=32264 RepID=UPI000D652D5C|nr:uncharacterized protein LOC107367795 isoform X2 [Tetranychus urticae]